MPTNVSIAKLIEAARLLGNHKTKQDALTTALSEYIARRERLGILALFGTIDYDPAYDYKAERLKKRCTVR